MQLRLITRTYLSDACFRKELLTSVHYFIHLNLAISLCLGYLVFVTSVQPARANDVSTTLTNNWNVIKKIVFSKAAEDVGHCMVPYIRDLILELVKETCL